MNKHLFLPIACFHLFLAAQPAVESRLQKDVARLADPARKGRGDGDPGLEASASFLLRRYRALGLKASLQRFPFLSRVRRQTFVASLGKGDQAMEPLVWGQDVEAQGASGNGSFRNKALAFLGYGLQTPAHDDFQGLDLKDRVALILRTVPDKAPYNQSSASDRSLGARIRRLIQANVAAVIVLEAGETPLPLRPEGSMEAFPVPVLSMPLRVAAKVCPDLPGRVQRLQDSDEVQSKDYIYAPWSFMNLQLALRREVIQLPNVIATLPGRAASKRQEHIILGARNLIHPGADDNASGTALVLELARRLRAHPLKRSVTFIHFAEGEEGLLGSASWIRTPTVPLDSVKAMLNFDGVGRLDGAHPALLLGGLGMPPSGMEAAKRRLPAGMALGSGLGAAMGAGDHVRFAMAKIPTFFFTGLPGNDHRPSGASDRINPKGMALVARFAYDVTRDLGEMESTPAFDPATAVLPTGGIAPGSGAAVERRGRE